jgi:hypothetical protein
MAKNSKSTSKKDVNGDFSPLQQKIIKGLELVSKRLVATTKKNNDYLIVEQNGKIVKLYGKDL